MSKLATKIEQANNCLAIILREHGPVGFANSFGAEDMVLTDLIAAQHRGIEIFTLDTGRLPAETYDLMQKTRAYYAIDITPYFPRHEQVEAYLQQNGPNGFYQSIDLRKQCCGMRKMEPLRRALAGKKAWITGLRREQAPTRKDLTEMEWDSDNQMLKFNPLIDWTHDDIWAYIREQHVPYNALHDQHYPSIGCAPCTRAIAIGEDIRAGRWWWENPETKECGLHAKKVEVIAEPISKRKLG